ncbi:AbrB/MazE/SpoVT family DNA-binding domain-containing protein [Roseofilum reptotaenium CS-1145]|uniref:AbrB family transcriptional regulator n=1 Tax=Roseofilum reptotaenium AO1-A TaxID=1925591 RepID=A0A1L9QWV5_9CYAN|nr:MULTISPECIES: AbrB/MazE/SpoVT family DNA-binding domain-containing protein [Roseofilum]MDB9519330.1 AbrB/MazE/SpoVT family DNA-binding domain-containing protein [Roseofilum reptotaenium CS-1145]OJJ27175.1 AbrB family transcriptional regulator [Roseofilum reptotaenium AO1-A]
MSEVSPSIELYMGDQGQLVIPAPLQQKLGVESGDRLLVRMEGGKLVLEKPEAIKQRLKARFANVPQNRSLVDELLAERRNETQKDVIE